MRLAAPPGRKQRSALRVYWCWSVPYPHSPCNTVGCIQPYLYDSSQLDGLEGHHSASWAGLTSDDDDQSSRQLTLENELPVTVRVWLFNASSIGGLSFSYLPQTTVSELSPFTGPAYGGTRVFILGSYFASATESQFESGDARFCRFRTASSNNFTSYAIGTRHPSIGTIVAARWHSPTKIECITPPANVQTTQHVYVEVTSNGGSNFSSSHVAFTYFLHQLYKPPFQSIMLRRADRYSL